MFYNNKNGIFFTGTREQAFVYAMSAAAAVWRLARSCALGSLAACTCAPPPRREPPSPSALISSSSYSQNSMSFALSSRNSFKWGGCGDDVRSASRMAKRFLQGSSPQSSGAVGKFLHAVNMHNNRAGRRVSSNFDNLVNFLFSKSLSKVVNSSQIPRGKITIL